MSHLGEKFTDRARRVMRLAKEAATQMQASSIDTHHVLLGLWEEKEGVAVRALKAMRVTDVRLKKAIAACAKLDTSAPPEDLLFSKETKKLITEAYEQAKLLNHNFIGTEHLLLSILNNKSSTAYNILTNVFNLELEKVRREILMLIGQDPSDTLYRDSPGKVVTPGTKSQKNNRETPHVDTYCIDLTQMARLNKLDPTIGRHQECRRVMRILGRKTKNNPVLIGSPGVGKSKVVEGIAQAIVEGHVPESLKDKRVCAVDLPLMIAGTKYRGQFEERIKMLIKEVIASKDTILFIDELHTMVGAGGSEGGMDASNILKPALSRGQLQCIGATTLDEYRKYIEKDGALERRFQTVIVDPPTNAQTLEILEGLQEHYEAHHGVKYTADALQAAIELSDRYISDRFLPDKAIDVIDEAGSKVKMTSTFKPESITLAEQNLKKVREEKERAAQTEDFTAAAMYRDEEQEAKRVIKQLEEEWHQETKALDTIDRAIITEIVSEMTGIQINKATEEEVEKLIRLEEVLHTQVISQDDAVQQVAKAVRRARSGLQDPNRPVGNFLFVGPTGVGKTLLCKVLAKTVYGSEDALIQLDMSEFMERHNSSKLIGAPPGYVGYDEGGQLTERVRRKPYSVILLDEIEKAHPDIFNTLLQIMEEGHITDSFGRRVNFKNTIIIMTSNVGSDLLRSSGGMGFSAQSVDNTFEQMKAQLSEEIEKTFKPEFLNRVDEIVVFRPLTEDDVGKILEIELKTVRERIIKRNLTLRLTDNAKKFLLKEGYNEAFGARPLRKAIRRHIEDPLAEVLLQGEYPDGSLVIADCQESETIGFKFEQPDSTGTAEPVGK